MMLDWNAYHAQILETLGKLARLSADTLGGYRTLSDAGTKTAHLDARTRELDAASAKEQAGG